MKLIGVWVAVMLLLIGGSCRSKSKALLKKETVIYQQHTSETSTRHRAVSVEQYGDTLQGSVPLPFQSPRLPGVIFPYRIPASSSGIDLEITLDSAGISYRAVAKPTGKIQVNESESQTKQNNQTEAILKESIEETEINRGFPWWILILIGIILGLSGIAWMLLKNHFKSL